MVPPARGSHRWWVGCPCNSQLTTHNSQLRAPMIGYLLRRLLWGIGVLLGVAVVTFVLRYLVPADPARIVGGVHATPQVLAGIRHRYGFDQPLAVQFVRYM